MVRASQVVINNCHSPECLLLIHLKLKTDTIMQLNGFDGFKAPFRVTQNSKNDSLKKIKCDVIFPSQTAMLPGPEILSDQEVERN